MKNRILIITPFLMQGGVEHSLITALSGIDYDRNDITLYLYKEDLTLLPYVPEQVKVIKGFDKTHYYRKVYTATLSVISFIAQKLNMKNFHKKIQYLISNYIHNKRISYPFVKYFKKEKFDAVISYCLHIGTEMALKIDADKHYLFLHNSHIEYHMETFEKCVDDYDALIAVSDGVKQVYSKEYPQYSNKINVIENYVDAHQVIEKSKDKIDINRSKVILCTCGRMTKEKGFDIAVESASFLKQKGIDFIWYFVGDGSERPYIQRLICDFSLEDNIYITGYRSNPYPYMKACDVYVQTSYEEAQPLTILEAMILGRPIVSTKTVGGKYILRDGERGVLCDIDSHSMATEILSLLKDRETIEKLTNQYTLHDNDIERQIYIDKWEKLLSQ